MRIDSLFALLAVALEILAWWGFFHLAGEGDWALVFYLVLHLLASAFLAVFCSRLIPDEMAQPRWLLVGLLAGCSYSVPVLGFVGIFLGTLYLRLYRVSQGKGEFASVQLPSFDPHQRISVGMRASGLRTFLGNPQASLQARIGGMVALQYVSGKVATPVLRELLSDSSEDIRLLAYGMLDSQEKRINSQITEVSLAYESASAAHAAGGEIEPLLKAAEQLSDLYWELIYQELAQGDLRRYAVQESLRYCDLVLKHRPDSPALNLRRGRLLHDAGQRQAAEEAYERARALGVPATRILPYLAELRFEDGDYVTVRQLMRELGQWGSLPRLRPVIDYWNKT
ncbi:MAG: hypothetical protein RBS35_08510 [Azonexus sp.]|jgi:tetratricopeptide (TPR) repeat protein|nr:hypothetical protein [Azonexus sp.]